MPTILINTNVKKKCKKPNVQETCQSSEILSKIATENTTTLNNNTLDEEFRNDLNSIINKLLVKSNMVRLILIFYLKNHIDGIFVP
jgi:hypothetical protein